MNDEVRQPRGFGALPPALRSAISRKGGKASHAMGKAHKFTSEEARAASLKAHAKRRAELAKESQD